MKMKETKNEFPCAIYLHGNEEEPIKLKIHYETLVGMLIVFLDEQGLGIEHKYRIVKGRSKHPLTFDKAKEIVAPYILSWYPETGEKDLTFVKKEPTMDFQGVYKILDMIHVQCNHPSELMEGFQNAVRIGSLMFELDINEIFIMDGEYQPEYKKFPINKKKKANIRRYTVRHGKRKRSIITPQQIKIHRAAVSEPFKKVEMVEKEGKNMIVALNEKRKVKANKRKNLLKAGKRNVILPSSLSSPPSLKEEEGGKEGEKDE